MHEEYAMLLSETRSKIKKFASNWNNRILKTFTSAKFWIAGASCVRFWKRVTFLCNAASF